MSARRTPATPQALLRRLITEGIHMHLIAAGPSASDKWVLAGCTTRLCGAERCLKVPLGRELGE